MFERFTDRARRVVVLSQEESRLFSHDFIGPEHLLVALLHEGEAIPAQVMTTFGASVDKAKELATELLGPGGGAPGGHIPFTDECKNALQLALRESLQLGVNYIAPEHLLLGLIRQNEPNVETMLTKMCGSVGEVRAAVIALLPKPAPSVTTTAIAETRDDDALSPMVACVALLNEMEPRHRRAALAYLNAWYAE